jgi:hypothetical protein
MKKQMRLQMKQMLDDRKKMSEFTNVPACHFGRGPYQLRKMQQR